MKLKKRTIWIGLAVIVLLAVIGICASKGKKKAGPTKTVKVERKNVVEKALAVGSLEPENEIGVKSKISGVVG